MELTSRVDIEAPIDFVFAQVTDFTAFERQALRRGASVRRADRLPQAGVGMLWDVSFMYRGKERQLRAELTRFDPPNGYVVEMSSGGITGQTLVDLVALSRGRTRLALRTHMTANGLTARLLLQSLKLARVTLTKRLTARVTSFAHDVEGRFSRQS